MTTTNTTLVLPPWASELRPHQRDAVDEIVEWFRDGVRVVTLDAPTGSGKTLIAECVRQMLDTRAVYTCTTKSLQDQVVRDFEHARVIKGRVNYTPLLPVHENLELTCADCNKRNYRSEWCDWCEEPVNCPYERAKNAALGAQLAVLNTSYLLSEANGPARFGNRGSVPDRLTVIDECDLTETEIMRHVSVDISPRRVARMRLGEPEKVTKVDSWQEWLQKALYQLARYQVPGGGVEALREAQRVANLRQKLKGLEAGLAQGHWVYTGKDGRVSFKPVVVKDLAEDLLWRHSQRWLLMSATVLSPRVLLEDELGWEDRFGAVNVGMTFPVENRPVYVCPVADMSKKGLENSDGISAMASALGSVLRRHPGERVLVHCVSYALGESLVGALQVGTDRPILTYRSSGEREAVLRKFRGTEESVCIASSFDRGIDLPDDLCRVVVVAKLPFPYLGDRQVSARLHTYGGQQWYDTQTARSLVQMTGRHVRHADDWGVSYILDSNFDGFYAKARRQGLLPRWWMDALRWEDPLDIARAKA